MSLGRFFDLFGAIVSVGLVTVVVTAPNTSGIIRAWGDTFSGSLRAAMGH
jgi:hypothetical protein